MEGRCSAPAQLGLGPSDWDLFALLTFAGEEEAHAALGTATEGTRALEARQVREWFPPRLRAHFERDGARPRYRLRGAIADAAPFERSPLGLGFCLLLGREIYVELHTM